MINKKSQKTPNNHNRGRLCRPECRAVLGTVAAEIKHLELDALTGAQPMEDLNRARNACSSRNLQSPKKDIYERGPSGTEQVFSEYLFSR